MSTRDDTGHHELLRQRELLGSALEASEQLARGILAAVPAGVVHVTIDGAVNNANAEALRLLGLGYDALTRRYTSDFETETIWEDGSPCSNEDYPVTRTLVTGQSQPPTTIGVRRPDGGLSWCIFRSVPVKGVSDELTGAVVTILDITDRKAMEDSLRRSQAELEAIVESAPGLIITTDLEARINFINRMAPGLSGEPESIVGQTLFEWVNERDHAALRRHLERAQRGETVSYELEGLDGIDPNWYATRIGPIVRDGAVVGFAAVVTIITEKRRAEAERAQLIEQLHQAQRLEALGRLAGGIAHDFNNLLTVIQGNTDLLARRTSDAHIAEGLGDIAAATERAASLTRQLLAFGRRQALEPRDLDIGQVAEGLVGMLRRLSSELVEIRLERDPHLGLVRADPVAIERVIVNLAVNGSEAMPEGGVLTIACRNLELAGESPTAPIAHFVCLEVTDTGRGMDEATQTRVFEPFFTTKDDGTGLGLATVHGIVSQSGGRVSVESRASEGTTFRVMLPRIETPVASEERPPVMFEPIRPGGARILLVEDDPAVRRVAHSILEGAGYDVIVAVDAQAALDIAAADLDTIDLLLSDVVMPQHSGPAIAAALRARSPRLRVLLISGHLKRTLDLPEGHRSLLYKPFTAKALVARVEEMLSR